MTTTSRRRPSLRTLAATSVLAVAVAGGSVGLVGWPDPASADAGLSAQRSQAATLRQAVQAETRRIDATSAGLADAERRLSALEARVRQRRSQLERTQDDLVRARIRLSRLEKRAAHATRTLAANLRAAYESGRPDLVTMVLTSSGFSDLLDRVDFIKRISAQNGRVLDDTREAKRAVARQTVRLGHMRARYRTLATEAVADRNHADVLRNALLRRKEQQLGRRAGTSAKLARVRAQVKKLERRQAAAARAAAQQASATSAAPSTGSSGSSAPSSGGSGTIGKLVAAANDIASTPYVWGGGHGGASGGYDCSGSISYALAAAGLLSSPLDSTGFMSWGEPGPGKHITVYANAGHAYMYVDGRRYDTSALSGGGTRWTTAPRSNAGFVARHPPGY